MRFLIHREYPRSKQKESFAGEVDIDRQGQAFFFAGQTEFTLLYTRIVFMGADVLLLSGMEPDGFDKTGRPKYKYQEWILRQITGGKDGGVC